MNPILELIARLTEGEGISALDLDALREIEAALRAEADALLDAESRSDDDLAALEAAADALASINAEYEAREAVETERAERAAALAARIRGEADEAGDDEGEPTVEAEVADEPVAEVEDGEVVEVEADTEPVPVAASAAPRPRIGRVAARRPAAMQAAPQARPSALPDDIADWGLVASANAPDLTAGQRITTRDQLAAAFLSAYQAGAGFRGNGPNRIKVATIGGDPAGMYGEDRTLDLNVNHNIRKIAQVTDPNAIVASGGICAPTEVRYDLPVLGVEERPVRDQMLVRFGADRGGVRVMPTPVIEDVEDAITVWSEATDASPGGNTKNCLTITCPEEVEDTVNAIVKCLETGNFRARYFPEQIEAWMRLAAVNHARAAEQQLLGDIAAASTAVTSGQLLGATRDILATLDRALAVWRYRHRLPRGVNMRLGLPQWTLDMIRADLAREMPGSADERLAVADATIASFFSVRGITPTFLLDGESGQRFGVQGDGPLQGWPSTIKAYLYPEGTHLFLDGGSLDLGIVRDSSLNSTNDLQMWAETFEGHIFHGAESWTLTMDVCPDGAAAGTVDINPCTTGS